MITASAALAAAHGQTWRQVGELVLAFGLSSIVGLERQIRGKSAGLRTQAIVGTASALILLVSKYGFADVLSAGTVVLDPSRVAAQIVSGIGFLGAGLIITRRGAIRGLTTAAAVWETAAIGMAAGAGLPLLALTVTALHFVIVLGYTPLMRHLPNQRRGTSTLRVTYEDGKGVLRHLLAACTEHAWTITDLAVEGSRSREEIDDFDALAAEGSPRPVSVVLGVSGDGVPQDLHSLAAVDGVLGIDHVEDENE
jgi:putative Mg2+ transporter-C (MgtC) family protein